MVSSRSRRFTASVNLRTLIGVEEESPRKLTPRRSERLGLGADRAYRLGHGDLSGARQWRAGPHVLNVRVSRLIRLSDEQPTCAAGTTRFLGTFLPDPREVPIEPFAYVAAHTSTHGRCAKPLWLGACPGPSCGRRCILRWR